MTAFAIFDCRDGVYQEFHDQLQFKQKLVELTKKGAVEKFSVFESKLEAIPFQELMHLPMPEGKRLRHEYCELRVNDALDQALFVSIEKGKAGLLAQISTAEEDVSLT